MVLRRSLQLAVGFICDYVWVYDTACVSVWHCMNPKLQCIFGSICSGVIDIPIRTGSAYALHEYQTNHRNS